MFASAFFPKFVSEAALYYELRKLGTSLAQGAANAQLSAALFSRVREQLANYRFLRTFSSSPDPQVLAFLRGRLDDYLRILDGHVAIRQFVAGNRPTVADISMIGYLMFPANESGYDFAASHLAIRKWLDRVAALPGWAAPYDLLPGHG